MGEQRAVRERISRSQAVGAYFGIDDNLPINSYFVYLCSLRTDNLICVHNAVFGYNNCELNFTLEARLMFKGKSVDGEIPA